MAACKGCSQKGGTIVLLDCHPEGLDSLNKFEKFANRMAYRCLRHDKPKVELSP
jgi:hypothetical protein